MNVVRRLVPRSVRHGISAQLARVHATRLAQDLGRLAAGSDTIVVGPWLGEVGFELLYWVPFLRWFAETFRVPPQRLLIVSRGGTAPWYRPFAAGYRDIFDYLTPEEFRRRHDERVAANGEQKQTQVLAFERQVLRELTKDVHSRSMLHPSTMYGLFNPFWWGHVDETWVHRFAVYERLRATDVGVALGQGDAVAGFRAPDAPYTAVKFYFNDCFPDTPGNRAFVRRTLQALTACGPVVSLATGYTAHTVAADPRGRFMFAGSFDDVFSYRLDAETGALVEAPWSTPFREPKALAADPNGRFLYVGGYYELAIYAIDPEHGALADTGLSTRPGPDVSAIAIVPAR